jgi:hypothetical protein
MRRLMDEHIRRLRNAGWRSLKLAKKLRRAVFKHLPVALRRGETLYRRTATTLGASKPTSAIAHGRFLPYRDWPLYDSPLRSFLLFPEGSWGILYPPGSLDPAIGDRNLIRKLALLNDDVWFKAMSLMRNVPCSASGQWQRISPIHFKPNVRLWDLNQHGQLTDEALGNVFGHFGLTADTVLAKEATLRGN